MHDGDIVLDVACGNGTLLKELSKRAKIQANGLDISENMIHAAKMRYPNMNFTVQSCYHLQWSDESIDVITVCCAFHHFDNPQGFADECKRVLKKNGTLYIADPNFGPLLRFFANKFWLPFSKSGDVRVYSPKVKSIICSGAFCSTRKNRHLGMCKSAKILLHDIRLI